jgi:hypothetical protein
VAPSRQSHGSRRPCSHHTPIWQLARKRLTPPSASTGQTRPDAALAARGATRLQLIRMAVAEAFPVCLLAEDRRLTSSPA